MRGSGRLDFYFPSYSWDEMEDILKNNEKKEAAAGMVANQAMPLEVETGSKKEGETERSKRLKGLSISPTASFGPQQEGSNVSLIDLTWDEVQENSMPTKRKRAEWDVGSYAEQKGKEQLLFQKLRALLNQAVCASKKAMRLMKEVPNTKVEIKETIREMGSVLSQVATREMEVMLDNLNKGSDAGGTLRYVLEQTAVGTKEADNQTSPRRTKNADCQTPRTKSKDIATQTAFSESRAARDRAAPGKPSSGEKTSQPRREGGASANTVARDEAQERARAKKPTQAPATNTQDDWKVVTGRRRKEDPLKKGKELDKVRAVEAPASSNPEKGRRRARGKRRTPPETIVVSRGDASGGSVTSYADVLRSIHAAGKDLEADVKKVRRNRKGDLLFQLGRSGKGADALEAIIKAAGTDMVVSREAPTRQVIVRDLDEGITREEVQATLQRALEESTAERIRVTDLRPAHDGTQVCTAWVPDNVKSGALLREGRVRMGLVRCRLRERVAVTQCFRCLGSGLPRSR